MRLKTIVACWALGLCALTASAQMGGGATPVPLGTQIEPAKAVDELLSMLEEELMPVVKVMPVDKYTFAPSAAIFVPTQGEKYDGVRTFAQQATHVAMANYHFAAAMSGLKPERDVAAIAKMTSKDDIVQALADSFAFAHKANATITPENAFLKIKSVDGATTRATAAAIIPVHGFDHYGQMVEYLRMNGIIPPATKM